MSYPKSVNEWVKKIGAKMVDIKSVDSPPCEYFHSCDL